MRKTLIFIVFAVLWISSCEQIQPVETVRPTALPANPVVTPVESTEIWPTKEWLTSTPAEQGMDPEKLAAMLEAVQQKTIDLHSLLVIRHGYIVSETYFQNNNQRLIHELYSCTKSFISTLVGIAIDQGYIQSLDQKILDFFPGQTFQGTDNSKAAITLEDMLTMTSGLGWAESDSTNRDLYMSRDWVKFVLDFPMTDPPGKKFNYCTGCTHVVSVLLKNATGQKTADFAQKNLFAPLGITNYYWATDKSGNANGGWGLQLAPRDMAKLGYLYLHKGVWESRQIVSQAWVDTATQKHVPTDGSLGYGYQWWVYPSYGAYTALGLEGQTIFVIPSLDLIVVTTARIPDHQPIFDLIDQFIVPSILN
jgi:CubicO group peptidase (beta-lactamase class C family)